MSWLPETGLFTTAFVWPSTGAVVRRAETPPRRLDSNNVTTHNYGMVSTKHRTSFALDEETMRLIQQLASQWGVSQAEVVRRAVRMTADAQRSNVYQLRERLRDYQEAGGMTAETADQYLNEVSADRAGWERGGLTRGGAS